MSVFTQFTSAQGGSVPALTQYYISSGTFVPVYSGWYGIYVVGAGGGGGASCPDTNNVSPGAAQGGAAGGSALKLAYLSAGASVVITIGAGGAGAFAPFNNGSSGSSGAITTVVGGGVSITCNAGAGGGGSVNTNLTAKVGGNATGGDFNWTGLHIS